MEKFKHNGSIIYDMAPDVWERMYPQVPFSEYLTQPYRTVGIEKKDGRILTNLAVKRLLKSVARVEWYEILARYTTMPNGQVKNFLVACRTYLGGKGKVRICLRGSKSGQGGGIWHIYYGALLLRKDQEVVIDCFDDSEVTDRVTHVWEGKKLTMNWISSKYDGDGLGYDVFIDDAWVPEHGIQKVVPRSEYWSLKGVKTSIGYVPFLHEQETRLFSHNKEAIPVECQCMVCTVCAQSVTDYGQYEAIRAMLSVFGHEVQCITGAYAHYDLVVKGHVLRHVLTHPSSQVFKPAEMRASIVLQNELPLQHPTPLTLQYDPARETKPQALKHGKGFKVTKHVEIYRWLEGRRVGFFGVSPSILGSTKIHNIRNSAALSKETVEVAFFSTMESMDMASCAPVVYLPIGNVPLSPWKPTGRSIDKFLEYEYTMEKAVSREMYYSYYDGIGWRKEAPICLFERVLDEDDSPMQRHRRMDPYWKLEKRPKNEKDFTLSAFDWKERVLVLRTPRKLEEDPSKLMWRSSDIEKECGFFGPDFWPPSVSSYCDRRLLQVSRLWIPKSWQGKVLEQYEGTRIYAHYRARGNNGFVLHKSALPPDLQAEWHVLMNHDMRLHDSYLFDLVREQLILKRKYS